MAERIIVLIADKADPGHGEITVLDGIEKAERLIETLLEAGYERERIRVFSGGELEARVSHRPVVALAAAGEPAEAAPGDPPPDEGLPNDAPPAEAQSEPEGSPVTASAQAPEQEAGNGFASLFRRRVAEPVELMPELLH